MLRTARAMVARRKLASVGLYHESLSTPDPPNALALRVEELPAAARPLPHRLGPQPFRHPLEGDERQARARALVESAKDARLERATPVALLLIAQYGHLEEETRTR